MTDVAEENNESNVPIDFAGTAAQLFTYNPKKLMVFSRKDHSPAGVVSYLAGQASTTDTKLRFVGIDANGNLNVNLRAGSANNLGYAGDNTDAQAVGTGSILKVVNRNYLFNGTTWDRARGANNFASPAAAATPITLFTAGGAGTFYRIFKIIATLTVAGNLTVSDGTTNWLNAMPLPAGGVPSVFDFGAQGVLGSGAASAVTASFTGGGNATVIAVATTASATA